MPLTAYLSVNNTVYPCWDDCSTQTGGEIWTTDKCTINEVYKNGWCKVTYPGSGGDKTAFTQISNFIPNTNLGFSQKSAPISMNTYSRDDLSVNIGSISTNDPCYLVGTSGSTTQAIYPTQSGLKLGWSPSSSWNFVLPDYDERFNPYCPIVSYLRSYDDQIAYESDFTTWDGISKIESGDRCTINSVYKNGWCNVTYPLNTGGTKTKNVPLSSFVKDTSATPVVYNATVQVTTYRKEDMSENYGWLSPGDRFFLVSTSGSVAQVLYPVDAEYGGGYKLGWIYKSDLPVTEYSVSYNANGGTGAPAAQTKRYNESMTLSTTIPVKEGYNFLGWARRSDSTNVQYSPGAQYTDNSDLILYAIWSPKKFTIVYDVNGGNESLDQQVVEYNSTVKIANQTPTCNIVVFYEATNIQLDEESKTLNCRFLGWSTSKTATTPMYSPNDSINVTKDITLYAVWEKPYVGELSILEMYGYSFLGWFTAETGGVKVTANTVIDADTIVYAHWQKSTEPTEPINPESAQFKVSNVLCKSGETIKVDVSIENNPAITSLKIKVNYPSNVLTLTSVEYKDLFSSRATGTNRLESPFTISWFSSGSVDETANGVLATLTFTVAQNAEEDTYPITITYDPDDVFDSNFDNKEFTVVNGEIIVSNSIPGDVNGDRKINMKDIVLLQQYLNGWNVTIDMLAANVNDDTKVNMKDIVLLQQYLNGWDVELK